MIWPGNKLKIGDLLLSSNNTSEIMSYPVLVMRIEGHTASFDKIFCLDSCGRHVISFGWYATSYDLIRKNSPVT